MKNRRALLLSSLMLRGYGVSVVAHEIANRSSQYGWDIYIGCLSFDESFSSDFIIQVGTDPAEVLKQCESLQIDVVIAQTTPILSYSPPSQVQSPPSHLSTVTHRHRSLPRTPKRERTFDSIRLGMYTQSFLKFYRVPISCVTILNGQAPM